MKLRTLALDSVQPDPKQPRLVIDEAELKPLAMSMRDLGQLQPVIVYRQGNFFILVDGHRRVASKRLIGHTDVEAIELSEEPNADTLLLTQLAANCMRVDLKPTEKALAYRRLKDSRGWTNVELANAMHVSKSTVTQVLSYLDLSEEVKQKLDAGELAGSTAYAISRVKDGASAREMEEKAISGELKRDDAVRRASGKKQKVRSTFCMESCDVCVVGAELFELPEIVTILQQLARECAKAAKNDHDVITLERALAKKRKSAVS